VPIYDLSCPACGAREYDRYVPFTHSVVHCACGAEMEHLWAITGRSGFTSYPYMTKNITGRRIEVRDAGHERELLARHNKVKRDDSAFIGEDYLGYDMGKLDHATGKRVGGGHRYASGRGLPGQWF
jgi:hypothetical protein